VSRAVGGTLSRSTAVSGVRTSPRTERAAAAGRVAAGGWAAAGIATTG
jgi:hypothetical protein